MSEQPAASGAPSQASELFAALRGYGRLPGFQTAALSGLIGVAVVLAAALAIALVMPDSSLLDLSDDGNAGLWQEFLNQASAMTLASFDIEVLVVSLSFRFAPLLFVAFPIAGCALGAYLMASRAILLPSRQRFAWGVATAVPFALAMLLVSVLAGTTGTDGSGVSPSEPSVFLLSLVWGGLGGAVGAALALRRDGMGLGLPAGAQRGLGIARATLLPLALALAIAAAVGTAVWAVQTIRDSGDARGERSVGTALADDVFFAGDFGLRYLALGTGAQFHPFDDNLLALGVTAEESPAEAVRAEFLPIPLSTAHVPELIDTGSSSVNPEFTVFAYGDPLPAWFYAPLLLLLILVPAFLALAAGVGAARAVEPASERLGAAWGASVGPIWALITAALATLSQDVFFGQVVGNSLLLIVLLGGAALGALGGYVACQARDREPASPGWA